MRLLAVIGSELVGGDERSNWAALNVLVAANGAPSIEVRVIALVNSPTAAFVLGNPIGRSVGRSRQGSGSSGGYRPSDSARSRLDRALMFLRGLGLRASGEIEPGNAYRAVRQEAELGNYDRVLVLVQQDASWPKRTLGIDLVSRLRRALDVPVDGPQRRPLTPPQPGSFTAGE